MSKRWQIGIIGFGWAGERHAGAIQTLSDRAEISAVAEINPDIARGMASRWNVPFWTTDYNELLEMEQLDAVSICLPHDFHANAAVAAAAAGLHILIEKPIATTLSETDAMIDAADDGSVILMVAENVRFHSTYIKASEMIRSGIIGELVLVRICREHQTHDYLRKRPWFLEAESAGIMVSGGIHDFELLRMLAGDIEHVYGLIGPKVLPEMEADDTSVALAGLHSGALGVIVESFSIRTPKPGVFATINGSKGSMWIEDQLITIYLSPLDGQLDQVEEITVPLQDAFVTEMEHFLDCLDGKVEPLTSGREERKPLVAVLAAYESFKSGNQVYLSDLDSTPKGGG